jgi:hypothetical protein
MRIAKGRLPIWPGVAARMLALSAGLALVASLVAATGNTAAGGLTAAQGPADASRPAVLTPTAQWGACPAAIPAQFPVRDRTGPAQLPAPSRAENQPSPDPASRLRPQ